MTRIYSELLSMAMDSHNDSLFTFYYDMPEEYKPIFEHKFLLRFGYRNIGYDSYQMFKRMLESRLLEIMPRYLKLYESENVIDNPFINTRIQSDTFSRNKGRRKLYETINNKSHHFGTTSGSNTLASRSGSASGSNSNHIETNNAVSKQRGISDSGTTKLNLFADTPQSTVQSQSQTQTQAQGVAGDGSGSGTSSSANYFNDGYITTATKDRDTSTQINSGSENSWNQKSDETGISEYGVSGGSSNSVDQSQSKGGDVHYHDRENVSADQETTLGNGRQEGLSGVLVSDALLEWRKTFINIDFMLLDDLECLFMGVY